MKHRVEIRRIDDNLDTVVESVMSVSGICDRLRSNSRVAIKPNFTYPYYKRGVTTSPEAIRAVVGVLRRFTSHISIVETDGGYGAWRVDDSFAGHGVYDLEKEFGVEAVNLCVEPSEIVQFRSRDRMHELPLPSRLLHETDLFITMPVPKIHCMTGLTLSYKNQWGCIPDIMRLRRHYIFNDAIVAINRALKPMVVGDGIYFLDRSGPMEGVPVRMDLIVAATSAGVFDRYVSELMGWDWRQVPHLKRAVALGDMPSELTEVTCNISPRDARTHVFRLQRTFRNYIAISGFKSRFLTWLGYESWFGRVILHSILYAIAGKPVKPSPSPDQMT